MNWFTGPGLGVLDARYVAAGSLATVATSGAYADLTGTPTLGTLAAESWPASDGNEYVAKNGAWTVASGGGAVDSVFGRTGAVAAQSGDYTAAQVGAVALAGDTMTGLLKWSGTTHAGLQLNSLTTAQRDALTPAAGMMLWNTSTSTVQRYGTAWKTLAELETAQTWTAAQSFVAVGTSVANGTKMFYMSTTYNGILPASTDGLRTEYTLAHASGGGTHNANYFSARLNHTSTSATSVNCFRIDFRQDKNTGNIINMLQLYPTLAGGTTYHLYGLSIENISGATNSNYAIYTNAGDIRLMASSADKIGLHGATPQAQTTGWSTSNVTATKTLNVSTATLTDVANVLGTLLNTLLLRGDIGA